jgi:hypothetical protein
MTCSKHKMLKSTPINKILSCSSLVLGSQTFEPGLNLCEPEPKVQFKVQDSGKTEPKVQFTVLRNFARTRLNRTLPSLLPPQ